MSTSAITYTMPGVPLLNQLNERENARMDCVFTSNAALATAYLGKPYTGTQIKDMDNNYGTGYVGGASEKNLVDTMARLGIQMVRVAHPTQAELIDEIHWHVPQGHGVIVTMPSNWGTAPANPRSYDGPSHVGLACGVGPGMIRVMNPWGGFWQDESDSWWAARLLDGEVWVGTKIPQGAVKVTTVIPTGWKDDGKTLVAPNGVPVVHGFRDYILARSWDANNWPLAAEQVITSGSIEPGNAAIGPGSRQDFRLTSLGWTQAHNVYVIYVGQDIRALEQQLAAANAHVAQLEAQVQQLQSQLASQPVPVPVVTPPDPKATEALNAVIELAKALKLVAA